MPSLSRLPASPVTSLAYFPVSFRIGSSLLRGRSRRALSAEEVTITCEVLLAAAIRRRCPYWLLDGRVSPFSHPVDLQEWLKEDYFPRVRAQLGQAPCIALLVTPCLWNDLHQEGQEPPSEWPSWGARVGWFKEEDAALAWLRQQEAYERNRMLVSSAEVSGAQGGAQLRFSF